MKSGETYQVQSMDLKCVSTICETTQGLYKSFYGTDGRFHFLHIKGCASMSASASILVRSGNVRLRVSPNPKKVKDRRVVDWEVRWKDGAGRSCRLKRAKQEDAIAEAQAIAKRIAAGSRELSGGAAGDYDSAVMALVGTGFTLARSSSFTAGLCRMMAGGGVPSERFEATGYAAIDFYLRHHASAGSAKPLAEVVDELIVARELEGVSERHLGDLRSRGGRIKRDLGTVAIGQLSAAVLNAWLSGLKVAGRTRLNFWRVLSNLVNFAVGQKYLPRGWPEFDYVKKPPADEGDIEIFTPEELGSILRHARPSVLPAILLGAFGGLRTSETLKLDWSHVRWQREVLQVPRNTKTGPRNARLFPNLAAWLETIAPVPCAGPVIRISQAGVMDGFFAAATRAKVRWKHNGLRHSFVSYRAALDQEDLATVAKQAGHSVQTAERNYRRADIFREDALAWFSIYPEQLGFFGRLSYLPDRKSCPLFAPSRNGHDKIP